jgi:phosphatidylglycerol:prolipoprotein diacylglycerol transferase
MIGGVAAVWIIKRILRIKEKKGNLFAPALALGLVIGRIGCFLGGCCYGVATGSSWGIDFGDGIPRHPTQLYESVFALLLFVWLMRALRRNPAPGILFRYFIRSYFLFRFFISFIRAETAPVFWGLSDVQWVSIVVIVLSLREAILNRFVKLRKVVVYG